MASVIWRNSVIHDASTYFYVVFVDCCELFGASGIKDFDLRPKFGSDGDDPSANRDMKNRGGATRTLQSSPSTLTDFLYDSTIASCFRWGVLGKKELLTLYGGVVRVNEHLFHVPERQARFPCSSPYMTQNKVVQQVKTMRRVRRVTHLPI